MAQTKFVLGKALAKGLRPLVVFNKVDRPSARLGDVEGEVFDLFVSLEATDEQLDFPMVRTRRRSCTVHRVAVGLDTPVAGGAGAQAAGS